MTERVTPRGAWIAASRKRLVLAVYLDYLLFGAPWSIGVNALEEFLIAVEGPALFALKLILFAALETALVSGMGSSPGRWALSIHRVRNFDGDIGHFVDGRIKERERWWSVMFGVVAILDGTKVMVRGTTWSPPMPILGFESDETVAGVLALVFGCIECGIGIAVLVQYKSFVRWAPSYYAFQSLSAILSWDLLRDWAPRYIAARRANSGREASAAEIEAMQTFFSVIVVAAPIVYIGILLLIYNVCYRSDSGHLTQQ